MDVPIKVLMADDEEDVLNIMAKKVAEAGFEVVKALDGQAAWNKICLEDPDVILLDLTMPGMHGFEVLERLRANPPSEKWQPVIIVSANDELESVKRGFKLQADHYLTKPCHMEEIIRSINLMVSLIPQRKRDNEKT